MLMNGITIEKNPRIVENTLILIYTFFRIAD